MADPIEEGLVIPKLAAGLELHQGKIISVNFGARTCKIRPGGSTSSLDDIDGVKYLDYMTPVVNTYAWYLRERTDRILVGSIGQSTTTLQWMGVGASWWASAGFVNGLSRSVFLGGSTVQDINGNGDVSIGFGMTVTGIQMALAQNADAQGSSVYAGLFNPHSTGFDVTMSSDTGPLGDSGLIRLNWVALVWL